MIVEEGLIDLIDHLTFHVRYYQFMLSPCYHISHRQFIILLVISWVLNNELFLDSKSRIYLSQEIQAHELIRLLSIKSINSLLQLLGRISRKILFTSQMPNLFITEARFAWLALIAEKF